MSTPQELPIPVTEPPGPPPDSDLPAAPDTEPPPSEDPAPAPPTESPIDPPEPEEPTQAAGDWAMPPSRAPQPEPAVPMAEPEWAKVIPGEPAFPTRIAEGPQAGCWAAGGLVMYTLCVDEVGKPRCIHATPTNECSGPPPAEWRATATACVAFVPRFAVQL